MRCLIGLMVVAAFAVPLSAAAAPVTFSSATGVDQGAPYNLPNSIDGNLTGQGWANNGLAADGYFTISGGGLSTGPFGKALTFTLNNLDAGNPDHILGHYRLYATSSPIVNAGSTWVQLTPLTASRLSGGGITINPGVGPTDSILLVDTNVATDVTTITANATLAQFPSLITGVRIEAIDLAGNGLPGNGPGLASNGNWVLSELLLSQTDLPPPPLTPEPASVLLMGVSLAGFAGFTWWRRRRFQ